MNNTQALILGIVQGLTEYLPVSSSAHLVLAPALMGWEFSPTESFLFDVLVQLGTLVGVFCYFWQPLRDIIQSVLTGLWLRRPFYNEDARLGWLVALASVPAAILGLAFKSELAAYFSDPLYACYFLVLTGVMLIAAELLGRHIKPQVEKKDAVFIGLAQGLALLPGVSRSGSTISIGMICGLSRAKAAQFSFLMSVPVMLGASLVASVDLANDLDLAMQMIVPLTIGFVSAAITGYLVIKWFMAFVTSQPLYLFAAYCLAVGGIGSVYF
jgi:undecaprenyl-diphosphatase